MTDPRCSAPRLFDELQVAHGDGSFARRLTQLARLDLLVIDDFAISPMGAPKRNDLLELLDDRMAHEVLDNLKARIRQLTRRSGGRSVAQVVDKLRPYLLGWKAYFGMAQTPRVWRRLGEWVRHRLKAIQLMHWKRSKTIYLGLKTLGASDDVANQVAGNCHRWWRNSAMLLNSVLTIAYFDGLGLPRVCRILCKGTIHRKREPACP